jgi:methylmalonyl-CoA mutase N-terminal domain/subunit
LEEKIVECMEKVDAMGGIVTAISNGYIQREVARQAYMYEKRIQSGELIKVGVNKYRIEEEEERKIEFHEYDPARAEAQIKRLNEVRAKRDNAEVNRRLDVLRKVAESSENIMPYVIDTVRAYATVGEITNVLKEVFGEFKEPVGL